MASNLTVLEALQRRDFEAALESLLATWVTTRAPRVADAIDRLSNHAGATTWTELTNVSPPKRDELWIAIARRRESKDLGPLLHSWLKDPAGRSARFPHLQQFKEDPRLATALTTVIIERTEREMILDPAFVDYLIVLADPRSVAPFHVARDRYLGRNERVPEVISGVIERLAVRLGRMPHTPVVAQWLDGIFAKLPPPLVLDPAASQETPPHAPAERRAWELVRAVYAEPNNDELRLVCQDALAEINDPRAELIALGFRSAQGKARAADRKVLAELVRTHGKKWIGDLAKRISLEYVTFEKGFPSALHLQGLPLAWWKEIAGARELTTISTLRLSSLDGEVFEAVAATPTLHRVQSLHLLSAAYYGFRLERDLPRCHPAFAASIKTLETSTGYLYADDITSIRKTFPNLEHLNLGWPAQFFGLQPSAPEDIKKLFALLGGLPKVTLQAATRIPTFAFNVLSQLDAVPADVRAIELNVGPESWLLERREDEPARWTSKLVARSDQFDPARVRSILRELTALGPLVVTLPTEMPSAAAVNTASRAKTKRRR